MKEVIITAKRIKTEIITWVVCFILANLVNLYAIITYKDSSAVELVTSLGYVLVVSFFIYFVWSLCRIIYYGLKLLLVKKRS